MEQPNIAQMDFHPVPVAERRSPGRTKFIPARLYIDKWQEHAEAYTFIKHQQDLHGDGSRTLVRALVHYRDTVVVPLSRWRERTARSGRRGANMPAELLVAQLAFRAVPDERRHVPGRVKHISARLYIDKYVEHRAAYETLQSQQDLHGEGLKTLVRALLHYRDTVIRPMLKGSVDTGRPQLELDVGESPA